MDHQKYGRATDQVCVQKFLTFSTTCALISMFTPIAVLSRTDSSSSVSFKKSITFEPLIGLGCVSTRWTEEKVLCIFRIWLRG
jgi:hypothetical protein